MKRMYNLLSLFLIAVLLLSSCNSGLSITKRRYNKGYYVHQQQKHAEPQKNRSISSKKTNNKQSTALAEVAQKSQALLNNKIEGPVLTASAEKLKTETAYSRASGTIMTAVTNPVKTFRDLKDKINANPARSEALSLLWILIVVLLIAWLVGFLLDAFGAGWVIHILLVVALVLLILWLLRIV